MPVRAALAPLSEIPHVAFGFSAPPGGPLTEVSQRLRAAIADRYRIERELGQGGMATVYLADDLKHDRKVAIKVLKPELAAVLGAERFVQEIKTTAALSHPHILPLFDSGEAGGFLYYVMPYIEGETIREKLHRETQFGIEEAVKIATEVADALDYAHRHGVIHRDIKPENILLHDGRPMVMDFGIALAVSAAAGGRMTETGLSLGTPHYMSPEQATAEKEITARSDVYSLGSVLYEMLAGVPPHEGGSAQQTIMRIITETPKPVSELRRTVPPNVAAAVAKSLEKLPADRFGTARAFVEALGNPSFRRSAGEFDAPPTLPARPSRVTAALAVLAAVSAALALWGWLRPAPTPPSQPTTLLSLDLGGIPLAPASGRRLDVAPDGSMFVLVGTDTGGINRLFLRPAGGSSVTPIPGTEGAQMPAFSPDGEWIAFAQNADLRKVRVSGGAPLSVAQGVQPNGVMWAATGEIVFGRFNSVSVVPASGGAPRVTKMSGDSVSVRWPSLLPGGRYALVTEFPSLAEARVAVLDLETGEREVVIHQATDARYVAPGYVVYGHPGGGVYAVPFDLSLRTVTGEPVPVLDGVAVFSQGAAQFAVSASGAAVYVTRRGVSEQLVLVDGAGRVTALTDASGGKRYGNVRFSPDGRRIAYDDHSVFGGPSDVYVFDRTLRTSTRLTFSSERHNARPAWSQDGAWLAYNKTAETSRDIVVYRRRSDGSGSEERLPSGVGLLQSLTPGGGILLQRLGPRRNDIVLQMPSDTMYRSLLSGPANEVAAQVSPNGRWMAYVSDETGTNEVYVTSFPAEHGRWQVSQHGGIEPVWSPDGRGVYHFSGDSLMVTRVTDQPAFQVGERTLVLRGNYNRQAESAQYDVTPDGRSFVMVRRATSQAELSISVVLNWTAELQRRMAEGRR